MISPCTLFKQQVVLQFSSLSNAAMSTSFNHDQVRAFNHDQEVLAISGSPGCSSSTLLRPTTPKSDYYLNNLASLQRVQFPLYQMHDQKVRDFSLLRLLRVFQEFDPSLLLRWSSRDLACSLSILLRPTTPKATTTWTILPLFRELNFLPIKRDQKVRVFRQEQKSTCYFQNSGLFFINSSEANNPKRDYYLNNLAILFQRSGLFLLDV